MRRVISSIVALGMMFTFVGGAFSAGEKGGKSISAPSQSGQVDAQTNSWFKRMMEIKKEMGQIAQQVVESDKELQQMKEKVEKLSKDLREKLKKKLDSNKTYQSLKKEAKDIQAKWQESQQQGGNKE